MTEAMGPPHCFPFRLPGTWGQVAWSGVFSSHWSLLLPLGLRGDILVATKRPPCHPALGLRGTVPSPGPAYRPSHAYSPTYPHPLSFLSPLLGGHRCLLETQAF